MQPCEKEKERIHKIQNNSRVLQYINDVRQVHECKYMNYSWLYFKSFSCRLKQIGNYSFRLKLEYLKFYGLVWKLLTLQL